MIEFFFFNQKIKPKTNRFRFYFGGALGTRTEPHFYQLKKSKAKLPICNNSSSKVI